MSRRLSGWLPHEEYNVVIIGVEAPFQGQHSDFIEQQPMFGRRVVQEICRQSGRSAHFNISNGRRAHWLVFGSLAQSACETFCTASRNSSSTGCVVDESDRVGDVAAGVAPSKGAGAAVCEALEMGTVGRALSATVGSGGAERPCGGNDRRERVGRREVEAGVGIVRKGGGSNP